MVKQLHRAEKHSRGVGAVFSHRRVESVFSAGLEYCQVCRVGCSGHQASPTNQTSRKVLHDIAVQVGHHHHVELLRVGGHLHGSVVHNHVLKLYLGIVFGDFLATSEEEAVPEFHNVCLVYRSHLLPPVTTLRHSTTPGTDSCSRAEYSPSVCSRITTKSISLCRLLTPGSDFTFTTLAYKSK